MKSAVATAIWDAFPLTEGHTLIVPRLHVASLFELPAREVASIWQFVSEVRTELVRRYGIEAFNIGLNDGPLAGQTVAHAHIHLIPRRLGDVEEPRGGVRWVIPERANYWSPASEGLVGATEPAP